MGQEKGQIQLSHLTALPTCTLHVSKDIVNPAIILILQSHMLVLKQSMINEKHNLEMMKTVNSRQRNTITQTNSNAIIKISIVKHPRYP